jgi:hypothetical protein
MVPNMSTTKGNFTSKNPNSTNDILKSAKISAQNLASGNYANSCENAWIKIREHVNNVLNILRNILSKITGIQVGQAPSTNYILLFFFFCKDNVVGPIVDQFSTLEQSKRYAAILSLSFVLWLPALLISMTLLPTLVFCTAAFYLLMFGLAPLSQHLEESLNELTGWTTSVLPLFLYIFLFSHACFL